MGSISLCPKANRIILVEIQLFAVDTSGGQKYLQVWTTMCAVRYQMLASIFDFVPTSASANGSVRVWDTEPTEGSYASIHAIDFALSYNTKQYTIRIPR